MEEQDRTPPTLTPEESSAGNQDAQPATPTAAFSSGSVSATAANVGPAPTTPVEAFVPRARLTRKGLCTWSVLAPASTPDPEGPVHLEPVPLLAPVSKGQRPPERGFEENVFRCRAHRGRYRSPCCGRRAGDLGRLSAAPQRRGAA